MPVSVFEFEENIEVGENYYLSSSVSDSESDSSSETTCGLGFREKADEKSKFTLLL